MSFTENCTAGLIWSWHMRQILTPHQRNWWHKSVCQCWATVFCPLSEVKFMLVSLQCLRQTWCVMQSGHAVHEDEPSRVAEVLKTFLDRFQIGRLKTIPTRVKWELIDECEERVQRKVSTADPQTDSYIFFELVLILGGLSTLDIAAC